MRPVNLQEETKSRRDEARLKKTLDLVLFHMPETTGHVVEEAIPRNKKLAD